MTRRRFLRQSVAPLGCCALPGLLATRASAEEAAPPRPHYHPRARNFILLFMEGGPSHVDTFDPKPTLKEHEGKPIGKAAFSKKTQVASPERVWFGSPWKFAQQGQSGLWVSDLFPHIARIADRLCIVRSMVGEVPLHGQQNLLLHTGRITGQSPSIGAWVSYGLGTENRSLPAYMLLNNDWIPNGGSENFGSAFLPATHQATILRARGAPLDDMESFEARDVQEDKLRLLAEQDLAFAARSSNPAVIDAAVGNYETAFRMQSLVPQVADVSREPEFIQRMYGVDSENDFQKFFGLQCLRARRLVEAGVRFVEVSCPMAAAGNSPWDQHSNIAKNHALNALVTDQAVAALIADLDQRGLLEETIVLWAGEMGRSPHTPAISETAGRDHHVDGYSIFIAGGGFKPGFAFGQTDEFGNRVIENPVTIHDIHATILHQLGLDHEKLTYRFGGRDMSLTDVHGRIVAEILT